MPMSFWLLGAQELTQDGRYFYWNWLRGIINESTTEHSFVQTHILPRLQESLPISCSYGYRWRKCMTCSGDYPSYLIGLLWPNDSARKISNAYLVSSLFKKYMDPLRSDLEAQEARIQDLRTVSDRYVVPSCHTHTCFLHCRHTLLSSHLSHTFHGGKCQYFVFFYSDCVLKQCKMVHFTNVFTE